MRVLTGPYICQRFLVSVLTSFIFWLYGAIYISLMTKKSTFFMFTDFLDIFFGELTPSLSTHFSTGFLIFICFAYSWFLNFSSFFPGVLSILSYLFILKFVVVIDI